MKVYIDAACDIHYSSFYIKGLQEIYGKKSIQFSSKFFKSFKHNNHFFLSLLKIIIRSLKLSLTLQTQI